MNKLNSIKLILFSLFLLNLAILIPSYVTVAQPANNQDEMIPRKIVERLLRLNRVDYYRGGRSQLLIGKVPDNLPVEIPQPAQAEILGSIKRSEDYYEIALDIPQSATQVKSFYENQLTQKGWKQQEDMSPKRAFATSITQIDENLNYCKSEKGPALQLNLNQSEDTFTEVSISLNTNQSDSTCRYLIRGLPFSFTKTPILKPPANTTVIPKPIGGFSSEFSNSMATLESQLTLEQLHQHYMNQMQQAGWQKIADTKNIQTTLSMWSLKDKDNNNWQGIMTIKPIEGNQKQYLANLIIMQDKL
ncbi:hypothetical protein IQ247_23515 [Plectonema cf. radiosum LEGE 06105]|uniref:Uncharacterized protein n=1 Tax=Plectonema cf. radiosum LEGE 06105 TaxID=945769 RepID=A0A8J7FC05_9CYAN|nr:hypothetical protein [Plectonema radiosum]MBE9215599.1 hypothetical protein [Plectonema cf. radiosum LEGE 06105]